MDCIIKNFKKFSSPDDILKIMIYYIENYGKQMKTKACLT